MRSPPGDATPVQEVVRAEGLTKMYGSQRGIESVDLSVQRGEIFGFLGPNGAGKTTAIRVLLDLLRPTNGTVSVLGLDPRREGVLLRRKIGYLPGDLSLYEGMTGAQLIRFTANIRGKVDFSYARSLVERFQADLNKPVRALSRGNKQKLGIVLAFMHRPELLILDEPTSGLDPLMQHEFNRLALEVKAQGQTVFVSSHFLPEVEELCDRVGIINSGRMVAVESVGALKANALHVVEIRFDQHVPFSALADIPGVRVLSTRGNVFRCTVQGSMDPLVKRVACFRVERLITPEPSLDEIFLSYYQSEEQKVAA